MALMTINEYRKTYFTETSSPSSRTVKRWIESEKIYGEKIGGMYYVDPNKKVIHCANELILRVL